MKCSAVFSFRHHTKIATLALLLLISLQTLANHSPVQKDLHYPVSHKPPLLFWQAILPYGSENTANPELQAFTEFKDVLSTINALRDAMGAETDNIKQWHHLREQVLQMPLQTLLAYEHPYFLTSSPGRKSVHLEGGWTARGLYQFALHNDLPLLNRPRLLGDLSAMISIENGTLNKDTAIFSLDSQIHLGTLLFTEMLHSLEAFHQQLETNKASEQNPNYEYFDSQTSYPQVHSKLTAVENLLFTKLQQSTPNLTETLLRIVSIESLLGQSNTTDNQITPIRITAKLNKGAISRHYKASWQQLKTLLKHVSFRTRLTTAHGQLAEFKYDAKSDDIQISVNLFNGGIVLGQSIEAKIIYPSQLNSLSYATTTDIAIDFYGLFIHLENLTLNSNYNVNDRAQSYIKNATLDMTLNSPPNVKVEGALLYVLPSWLIDAFIPGTIETLIVDVFNQVVKGNHGYGAHLSLAFSELQGEQQLSASFNVEMPYSVLQDLLDTAIKKQKEDDAAIDKSRDKQIFDALRSSLRKDFDYYYMHYGQPSHDTFYRSP